MPSQTLNRLRTLETAMADMAAAVARTTANVDRLSTEMHAFKDEMHTFKDEMHTFKDEMHTFKDEMRAASLSADARAARDRLELRQHLGEIANHQGRLVEDIVAPSVERVLRGLLGLPDDARVAPLGPRMRLAHPGDRSRMREVDVLAAHEHTALVVEVKSQLSPEGVAAFAASLPDLKEYLAPLGLTEIIGAVATLYPDASIVAAASRLGLVVLGVGDELMEPKNQPGFAGKRV